MILKDYSDIDCFGNIGEFESIQYFGRDALGCSNKEDINKCIEEALFKDCVTDDGKVGIVIGIEDNNAFYEYYYIIYIPSTGKVESKSKIKLSSKGENNESMCNE